MNTKKVVKKEIKVNTNQLGKTIKKLPELSLIPVLNPGPIIKINKLSIIIYENPASIKIFGKLLGKSFFKQFNIDSGPILKILNQGKTYLKDIEHSEKTYQLTMVEDKKSSTVYIYGTDVTRRKKDELKIKLALEEISQNQKSQIIYQEKLQESLNYQSLLSEKLKNENFTRTQREEKMKRLYGQLEKSLEADKKIFLYTSHELKTPITPIMIQAEMLQSEKLGKLSDKQKESLDLILRNMERLNHLITDILEMTKLQTGISNLVLTKTNLKPLIDAEVTKFNPIAKSIGITIINNVGDIFVYCDFNRISQILTNLIDNALKFTKKGSITINAKIKDNFIEVSVKDTGDGIAEENIDKLFAPFSQIKPSYSLSHTGTGLGLAICKRLITEHGGKIWVESKGEGKGTTFYFTLPLKSKSLNTIKKDDE